MQNFLKYMGIFFLMVVAGSLAMLAVGVYQSFSKINTFFAGADTYTCGQFVTDLSTEGTSKVFPVVVGVLAYGGSLDSDLFEKTVEKEGAMPGVQKLVAACLKTQEKKVFDVLAADAIGKVDVSMTTVGASGTLAVSGTLENDHNNKAK